MLLESHVITFSPKSLEVSYFLGIEVAQSKENIVVSQRNML